MFIQLSFPVSIPQFMLSFS